MNDAVGLDIRTSEAKPDSYLGSGVQFWRALVFSIKPNFGSIISSLQTGLLPNSVTRLTVRGIRPRGLSHPQSRSTPRIATSYTATSAQSENATILGSCKSPTARYITKVTAKRVPDASPMVIVLIIAYSLQFYIFCSF